MKKRVVLLAMLLIVTILPATCAGSAHGLQWFPITPAPAAPATPSYVSYPPVSVTPAYPVTTFPKPVSPKPAMSFWYTGSLGSRTLKRTYPIMTGSDVRTLQTMLNALGYSCGRADGKFGDRTRAAVMAFQRRNGLKVDGIVGRATKTRLLSRYRGRR